MVEPSKSPPRYADAAEASHIYLLPNSLTAGNLFFGFLAILRCIQANYASDPTVVSQYHSCDHFFPTKHMQTVTSSSRNSSINAK